MFRTWTAISVAWVALGLPAAAFAHYAPIGGAASPAPTNYLSDGKYTPDSAAGIAQPSVVGVFRSAGFSFHDAGLGAAAGAFVVAALGVLVAIFLPNRGRRRLPTGSGA